MNPSITSQRSASQMDRANAKLTGLFFITATVTAIIGMLLYAPILKTGDYLILGTLNSSQIVLGAIFELILVVSMIGTAIMLFPYLRKYDGRFALGYLVFRLTEGIVILVGIVSMLALVTLGKNVVGAGEVNIDSFRAVGTGLIAIHDWTFILGPCVMLGINTTIYSYVLYRTKLVPRSLALLGLIGAVLILISGVLAMFDVLPLFTIGAMILALPVAVYEMILAGWLITKGFAVKNESQQSIQPPSVRNLTLSKPILAVSLILMTGLAANAQSSHLDLVVNTTDVNFNYGAQNSEMKLYKERVRGLRVGVAFQAGVTKRFSLATGLYYSVKGGTLASGNGITQNKSTLKLYSAELPALARFHFGKFYLNSGPYMSYIFSGRIKTSGPEAGSVSFNNDPDGFKRFEMGMQAGAGYVFDVKKGKQLAIDVRYGHGLTSLSTDVERYTRMVSISVHVFKPWERNVF